MQTQKEKKERKEGKEEHKKKRKKEKIYQLRTQIFVWLLLKFQVNSMIIMYIRY